MTARRDRTRPDPLVTDRVVSPELPAVPRPAVSEVDLRPEALETVVDGVATVDLAAGRYTARFLPGRGLAGASLTADGVEHLVFDDGDLAAGRPSGIPLLHPWANRLSRPRYEFGGVWVDVEAVPPVRLHDGLPIHGTLLGADGWRVEAVLADSTRALFQARFAFDEDAHLRSFPFEHELVVFVELSTPGLRVTTELRATGRRPVPVVFGWHPMLVLPGVPRDDLRVVLPARHRLVVDGRGLPTGEERSAPAGAVPLGGGPRQTVLDDCYRLAPEPGAPPVLAVAGGGRQVELELVEGYDHAQVWAPADATTVALEPMTAPVDALVSGAHRVVEPGATDRATFVLRVVPTPDP